MKASLSLIFTLFAAAYAQDEPRSLKSGKGPTLKSTKAPTVVSAAAVVVKSTKAPTIKSAAATTAAPKSRARRDLVVELKK